MYLQGVLSYRCTEENILYVQVCVEESNKTYDEAKNKLCIEIGIDSKKEVVHGSGRRDKAQIGKQKQG